MLKREQRGDASKQERKEMRRYARRTSLGARQTPDEIELGAWGGVLGGIVIASSLPVVLVAVVIIDTFFPEPSLHQTVGGSAVVVLVILLVICIVAGLCRIWYGVKLLRLARRLRLSGEAPPERMAGEIVCWMPDRQLRSPSAMERWQPGDTLIKLHAVNGSERIFRVPLRYSYRVRRRGAWVHVIYQPVSEHVLDVAQVEESVATAPLDGPQPT